MWICLAQPVPSQLTEDEVAPQQGQGHDPSKCKPGMALPSTANAAIPWTSEYNPSMNDPPMAKAGFSGLMSEVQTS